MVDFLKFTKLYFLISATVIGIGLFSIFKWGYTYSIEFVGGTNLEYQFDKPVGLEKIKTVFKQGKIELTTINLKDKTLVVRSKVIDEKAELSLKNNLEKQLNSKITVLRSETVGPTIGQETVAKTVTASLLGMIGILIYMSFAFKGVRSALAAIAAALHDILVIFGSYSLMSHFFGAQMDSLFVTAILTSMSLSVHDTIVVFDKIREYKGNQGGSIEYFANKALTETMVRSLNNTMTIIFMLLALSLLGGTSIRFFAVTLLIGTVTGTYSSPFVATPIYVWLEKKRKK